MSPAAGWRCRRRAASRWSAPERRPVAIVVAQERPRHYMSRCARHRARASQVPPGATSPGERRAAMFPHMMGGWLPRTGAAVVRVPQAATGAGSGRTVGATVTTEARSACAAPLRYLAYRLELDEKQQAELARRPSTSSRRSAGAGHRGRAAGGLPAFADALSGGRPRQRRSSPRERPRRVRSAGQGSATPWCLRSDASHALLRDEQRKQLAFLIRTGAVPFSDPRLTGRRCRREVAAALSRHIGDLRLPARRRGPEGWCEISNMSVSVR